jgi:HSP20 family protein
MAMVTTRFVPSPTTRLATINEALDHVLNSSWQPEGHPWAPTIDVIERKDAYVVYAELPGMRAGDIDMSFDKCVLTIRGSKRSLLEEYDATEMRVYAAERLTGPFERSIRLPDFVDADRVRAELANGVLVVTVPKAQHALPRQIEISVGGSTQQK